MQKEMAAIEQAAQDNHERARRLTRELSQLQREYTELKKQVRRSPGRRERCQTGDQTVVLVLKFRTFHKKKVFVQRTLLKCSQNTLLKCLKFTKLVSF